MITIGNHWLVMLGHDMIWIFTGVYWNKMQWNLVAHPPPHNTPKPFHIFQGGESARKNRTVKQGHGVVNHCGLRFLWTTSAVSTVVRYFSCHQAPFDVTFYGQTQFNVLRMSCISVSGFYVQFNNLFPWVFRVVPSVHPTVPIGRQLFIYGKMKVFLIFQF